MWGDCSRSVLCYFYYDRLVVRSMMMISEEALGGVARLSVTFVAGRHVIMSTTE